MFVFGLGLFCSLVSSYQLCFLFRLFSCGRALSLSLSLSLWSSFSPQNHLILFFLGLKASEALCYCFFFFLTLAYGYHGVFFSRKEGPVDSSLLRLHSFSFYMRGGHMGVGSCNITFRGRRDMHGGECRVKISRVLLLPVLHCWLLPFFTSGHVPSSRLDQAGMHACPLG